MSAFARYTSVSQESIRNLMKVALGEAEADLAIVNGDVVNVYTGEVMHGNSVLIKGDRIAYVGSNTGKAIGSSTEVIDASGKVLIPGLIDGHTHIDTVYTPAELVKHSIKGATTTIITEISGTASVVSYQGARQYLKLLEGLPVKFFLCLSPVITLSPATEAKILADDNFRKILKDERVLALGETTWGQVVDEDPRQLNAIVEAANAGKKIDGHSAGARDNKLQAYIAAGITSCHEPTTLEETLERLRLGLYVFMREGEVRRELDAISKIKDAGIDLSQLCISTDGIDTRHMVREGHVDFLVRKAIDLGFEPVKAIQMTTINVARYFCLDNLIGGIAPGKLADIAIIPDLRNVRAECVIANGKVLLRDGKPEYSIPKPVYPAALRHTVHLEHDLTAADFAVRAATSPVKVRVVDQTTPLITREVILEMPAPDGLLRPDTGRDILKVAAINRLERPGRMFTGFIRGFGLKHGAVANSIVWDCANIAVVGADEADMALAVNRIRELEGGIVVCSGGRVISEFAFPIAGTTSPEPMEVIVGGINDFQKASESLGTRLADIRLTMAVLMSPSIPFFRICEEGLVDMRQNRRVDLIVT